MTSGDPPFIFLWVRGRGGGLDKACRVAVVRAAVHRLAVLPPDADDRRGTSANVRSSSSTPSPCSCSSRSKTSRVGSPRNVIRCSRDVGLEFFKFFCGKTFKTKRPINTKTPLKSCSQLYFYEGVISQLKVIFKNSRDFK